MPISGKPNKFIVIRWVIVVIALMISTEASTGNFTDGITSNSLYAQSEIDDYGYENNYEGILRRLSSGEKTIKQFFEKTARTGGNRQIEIYQENNGNPEKHTVIMDESRTLPYVNLKIFFDLDSSYIRPESYPILVQLGKALTSELLKDRLVAIKGHTDALGSSDYNKKLSFKRAMSVKAYLIHNFNIDSDRLQSMGFGSEVSIVRNDSESNRQLNRRVEIEIMGFYGGNDR